MSQRYQQMMIDGLATGVNPAQIVQLEAPAAALTGIGSVDAETRQFYLLHTLYDIAGAAGQIRQEGSVVMTEPTFRAFDAFLDAVDRFDPEAHPAQSVYADYLAQRAAWLGLDPAQPEHAAMTRVGAMLRHSTPDQGAALMEAYQGLPPHTQEQVVAGLNRTGIGDGQATLIYYGPALLSNLQKSHAAESGDQGVNVAGLQEGLGTFARIYQQTAEHTQHKQDGVFIAMAAPLADAARVPGALTEANLKLEFAQGGARISTAEAATSVHAVGSPATTVEGRAFDHRRQPGPADREV